MWSINSSTRAGGHLVGSWMPLAAKVAFDNCSEQNVTPTSPFLGRHQAQRLVVQVEFAGDDGEGCAV